MVQDSDVQAVRGMGEKIRAMKADGQFDTAAFKSAVAEMEARKAELTPALEAEIGKRKMDNACRSSGSLRAHAPPFVVRERNRRSFP